jgi:hypothetical protein
MTPPSATVNTAPLSADHPFKFLPQAPPGGRIEDYNFILQSDLSAWGIQRESPYLIRYYPGRKYSPLELYTIALQLSPYDPFIWTARAYLYYRWGSYSRALGDLHRAWILTECVWTAKMRYRQRGLYARVIDAVEAHVGRRIEETAEEEQHLSENGKLSGWAGMVKTQLCKDQGVPYFLTPLRKVYHHLISLCLLKLEALEDYNAMDHFLNDRLAMAGMDRYRFEDRFRSMAETVNGRTAERAKDPDRYFVHEARAGWERPQSRNACAFNRTHNQRMHDRINNDVLNNWPGHEAQDADADARTPALRVDVEKPVTLNRQIPFTGLHDAGLRVIANRRIPAGQIIHAAEPNLRGHHRATEETLNAAVTGQLRELDWLVNSERLATRRQAVPGLSIAPRSLVHETLRMRETRQGSIRGGFRCENCKRGLTNEEVQLARKHVEAHRDAIVDAYSGTCGCLYEDPIVPFCTIWHDDWMHRTANVPGNSLATARMHDAAAGRPQKVRVVDKEAARHDSRTHPSHAMRQGLAQSDTSKARITVFQGQDYMRTRHVFPAAIRGDARPARRRPKDDDDEFALMDNRKRRLASIDPSAPRTCLDIALNTFHYRACGKDWKWLHDAIGTYTQVQAEVQAIVFSEGHGCQLALLLREVFDITLALREGAFRNSGPPRPHLAPDEIDALMPLLGEEGGHDMNEPAPAQQRRWPFSYAGNILVPFDIAMELGVDIFRDANFDTQHIQAALRKLHVNAVPWDHRRRDDEREPEESKGMAPLRKDGLPVLQTMYVHTGFSLFNHACGGSENASWSYDTREGGVPNRIVVWAKHAIDEGEEVRVNYWPDDTTTDPEGVVAWRRDEEERMVRMLGRHCHCRGCQRWRAEYPEGLKRDEKDHPVGNWYAQVLGPENVDSDFE